MKTLLVALVTILPSLALAELSSIGIQNGFNYRMNSTQVGASFTSDEDIWEVRIGKASTSDAREKEEQYNFSVGYKKMRNESFYYIAEASYYSFKESQANEASFDNLFDSEEEYKALGLGFIIGNQWIIAEHLLVAIDWAGIGLGLRLSSEDNSKSSPFHFHLLNLKLSYKF